MKPSTRSGEGLSLLLVEDDREAIEILGFIISTKIPDSTVELAYDGRMGLELFKAHRHDVVITDINMPRMDGIEMAEAIRELEPAAKIIVMTAYSDRIYQERFQNLGISRYLLKPLQFDSLISAINEAGAELEQQPE